jgi:hypothetical protein
MASPRVLELIFPDKAPKTQTGPEIGMTRPLVRTPDECHNGPHFRGPEPF